MACLSLEESLGVPWAVTSTLLGVAVLCDSARGCSSGRKVHVDPFDSLDPRKHTRKFCSPHLILMVFHLGSKINGGKKEGSKGKQMGKQWSRDSSMCFCIYFTFSICFVLLLLFILLFSFSAGKKQQDAKNTANRMHMDNSIFSCLLQAF